MSFPSSRIDPGRDRAQAEQRLGQLGLAVALHAGEGDDLAGAHRRGRRRRPRSRRGRRPRSGRPARAPASPGSAGFLRTTRSTLRPTIIVASSSSSVSAGVVVPTTRPWRTTVIRSATASTSLSLWVMNRIERPDCGQRAHDREQPSVSCGVSTAVGSSRISRLASRSSALRISTRCWTPTGRSSTIASGSTSRPNSADSRRMSARAFCRSRKPSARVGSKPSTTFSATVNTGTSMKCWWTMPMPCRDGVAGVGEVDRARRRSGSRRSRPAAARTARSSACSCRRRSRPAGSGSRPARRSGRCRRWPPARRSAW